MYLSPLVLFNGTICGSVRQEGLELTFCFRKRLRYRLFRNSIIQINREMSRICRLLSNFLFFRSFPDPLVSGKDADWTESKNNFFRLYQAIEIMQVIKKALLMIERIWMKLPDMSI